eukprot:Opistho-2@9517
MAHRRNSDYALASTREFRMRLKLASACIALSACLMSACTTAAAQPPTQLPPNNNPIQMNRDGPTTRGPVRNLSPVAGQEITTIRYWKIKKGTFPQFLEASQNGIWPPCTLR